MPTYESYPSTYRKDEIESLHAALRQGECAAVIGLSGAGKSNLLGFMASRAASDTALALVDCNRIAHANQENLYQLILRSCRHVPDVSGNSSLEDALSAYFHPAHVPGGKGQENRRLGLLLDRFDALPEALHGCLRALRDDFKYRLTLLIAARKAPQPSSELTELFYAHTLWLGPLNKDDARWSAGEYAKRCELHWSEEALSRLVEITWGYPGFLRAACEAVAAGCPLEMEALVAHPVVDARIREFLVDMPDLEDLRRSRLEGHPFLATSQALKSAQGFLSGYSSELTAKEALLLDYLRSHSGQVCEKDELICAVWPEDKIFSGGIRDDSLAQLIRRLRRKVEPDPGNPVHILNVTGRGYRFVG